MSFRRFSDLRTESCLSQGDLVPTLRPVTEINVLQLPFQSSFLTSLTPAEGGRVILWKGMCDFETQGAEGTLMAGWGEIPGLAGECGNPLVAAVRALESG